MQNNWVAVSDDSVDGATVIPTEAGHGAECDGVALKRSGFRCFPRVRSRQFPEGVAQILKQRGSGQAGEACERGRGISRFARNDGVG